MRRTQDYETRSFHQLFAVTTADTNCVRSIEHKIHFPKCPDRLLSVSLQLLSVLSSDSPHCIAFVGLGRFIGRYTAVIEFSIRSSILLSHFSAHRKTLRDHLSETVIYILGKWFLDIDCETGWVWKSFDSDFCFYASSHRKQMNFWNVSPKFPLNGQLAE